MQSEMDSLKTHTLERERITFLRCQPANSDPEEDLKSSKECPRKLRTAVKGDTTRCMSIHVQQTWY